MFKRMKLVMCLLCLIMVVTIPVLATATTTKTPEITTIVSVERMPGVKVCGFDNGVDYSTLIKESILIGTDESLQIGAIYEAHRNLKIISLGLDYETTLIFTADATLDEIRQAYEEVFGQELDDDSDDTAETATVSMTSLGSFKTTSYLATGNRTASGVWPTAYHTVAVDTSVIPLGTQLYIVFPSAYSYMTGYYTAEDTGGAVKGNIIDVFMDCSRSEALAYGVQYCDIYIVNE
jgi:3D (Asp-Asp-Asp) domain-containing protein